MFRAGGAMLKSSKVPAGQLEAAVASNLSEDTTTLPAMETSEES